MNRESNLYPLVITAILLALEKAKLVPLSE